MASRHLLNPLAPLGVPTPSALDGVPADLERDLRACAYNLSDPLDVRRGLIGVSRVLAAAVGALLIQQAGVMLKAFVQKNCRASQRPLALTRC